MTTKEKVKELIDAGYKPSAIALLSGVTTSRVSAIRKSLGLPSLWSEYRISGGLGRKPKKPVKKPYRAFCSCGLTLPCNQCLDAYGAGYASAPDSDPAVPFGRFYASWGKKAPSVDERG